MTITPQELRDRLIARMTDEVDCYVLDAPDGRIGCVTPLQYPDGDHVLVWVRPRVGGDFEVSDYGDSAAESASGKTKERGHFEDFAGVTACGQGAQFVGGRLSAECDWTELPEYVWRVAVAASQVGQAAAAYQPRAARETDPEDEFASAVATELQSVGATVERERKLDGQSGHHHRATLYLPDSETVIEPVAGHWNQVTAVFTRLADLGGANGYRLYSVLDDREGDPGQDVPNLLLNVSRVIQWSRRGEWLPVITER